MNLQLPKPTNLKMRILALLLVGFAAFSASAQLSGSYTINSGAATGGTNFNKWGDFVTAVYANGISASVNVTVMTDETITSQIVLPAFTTNAPTSSKTLTIDGNGKFLAFAGSYEVISFTGADYVTIKNLTVRHTANSTAAGGIRFSGGSDYNTIDNCTIEFSGLTSASTGNSFYIAFAYAQGSPTAVTSSSTGSYNTISKNLMRTTVANSPGPSYGIAINGNSSNYSSTPTNNTVTGNTIQNFYYMAIRNTYTNGNQFEGNDVSRVNAGSSASAYSQPYGIYSYYTYSTNRSTKYDGNKIHDLPYTGAALSQASQYYFYNYFYYNYGTAANHFTVSNNTFKDIYSYYYMYAMYTYYNYQSDYIGNTFDNVSSYSTASSYSSYIFYTYYGSDVNISKNIIKNCNFAYYGYINYIYNVTTSAWAWNMFEDNAITDNYCNYYMYPTMIYYYGNWKVNRNKIMRNSAGYYMYYALYLYYHYNMQINSNLITDNVGYYSTYCMYVYSFNSGNYTVECKQNTLRCKASNYSYHYTYYGLMLYCYYHNYYVTGNIVDWDGTGGYGGYYPVYTAASSASQYKEWDYNTFYLRNFQYQYWYYNGAGGNDFSTYANSGFPGKNERSDNPDWVNTSTGDYRSKCFETQNNAPTSSTNATDVNGTTRNLIKSDRGAMENFMDIKAESTNFSVPAQVCAGYSTGATTFTVKNLFTTDTAQNFDVGYSLNGGTKITQKVTAKILYNNTATVTFNTPLVLNKLGTTKIQFFIDIPDDNRANDTITFTTFVKPAPGGGNFNFSTKPTWAVYQYGKPLDVTVVNQPVIYNLNSPRVYSNASYGSSWTASAWAVTQGGVARPASEVTLTTPSGSTDMELKYLTSATSMEDTTITLFVKYSDLTNGCDTIIKRNVLIYPTIVPKFGFPSKVCDGDAVAFEQKSTIKSGSMEFSWNFGTGNPADVTDAPEPVFQFPGPGTYKVKMTAKTLPWGFPAWDSVNLVVSPIPTVKFTKANACEGLALTFTNQTVPSSATYAWDFGDPSNPSNTSTAVNPTKTYKNTGSYSVTLTANLNGCAAMTTQRVYQFDKPKASFALNSGSCDNDMFKFTNGTTIKNGLFGSYWDFNTGDVSTEVNSEYMFPTAGSHTVKLTVTSEFGCTDNATKTIVVKESPKSDFTNNPACSLTPTTFTNLTADVNGTIANYDWDFGDGGMSTAKSPVHSWTALGPKTITLKVQLDNGCSSSVSKMLSVGVQPKANFTATNVCSGEPVVFENNTTWAQGDINYVWDFGDATSSTNSDPIKNYGLVNKTTTYNVTLTASIAGGCSDISGKQVTVNESPKTCDFKASPDYAFGFHGIATEPVDGSGVVGAQTGVTYTWIFQGGGTQSGPKGQYDLVADGSFSVTMRARVNSTGCECTVTKTVVMNRANVQDLEQIGATVYPNPSNGNFNVALTENFGQNVTIEITNLAGSVVKVIQTQNTGLIAINAGDMADGMYLVHVRSGNRSVTNKINISK